MSGEESEDPEVLPEEPEVLSSPEPEVVSSPEFWTARLDSPGSAPPPPPIPVPDSQTARPAVKATRAEQRREAEELARTDEPLGEDEVEGHAEAERVAELERQRQPPDNINPTKDPEMIESFPEDITAESKLRQGHVPYWAECLSCVRARGLAPARSRSEIDPLECQ